MGGPLRHSSRGVGGTVEWEVGSEVGGLRERR